MLVPLKFNEQVCPWSDRDIRAGEGWQNAIDGQLREYAKAAVLLVSPPYLASDFVRNDELPVLLKRAQDNGISVISVILRHCFFKEALFRYPHPSGPQTLSLSVFQAINSPELPLSAMTLAEQDWVLKSVGLRLLEIFDKSSR
jgi:hypothetical protein